MPGKQKKVTLKVLVTRVLLSSNYVLEHPGNASHPPVPRGR